MGKYEYELNFNSKAKGFFNIYQGRNGAIYLQLNKSYTELTLKQVEELHIDVIKLIDFDHDKFLEYYNIKNN